jgi:hypothetical protein
MSVYPYLDAIQDPAAGIATKALYDRLGTLEATQLASKTLTSPSATVTGNTQRVVNLADPTGPSDAVNLRTLRSQIAVAFTRALQQLGVSRQSTLRP